MSMHHEHRAALGGEPLDESRERIMASATPFPPYAIPPQDLRGSRDCS